MSDDATRPGGERKANGLTRRTFIGRSAGVAIGIGGTSAFLAACGGSSSGSGGSVNVMGFVSYIDPTIKKLWAKAYPDITLRGVPAADDSEILTKLRAGGASAYDVVFTDFGYCPIYQQEGLVELLDLSRMSAGADLYPQFRDDVRAFVYLTAPNRAIGFPCQWAPTALAYNSTVGFEPSTPPTWADLWSRDIPQGKIGMAGLPPEGFIATAALAKGFAKDEVFSLSDSQLQQVVSYLREIKPFRIYTSDPELRNSLRSATAWASIVPSPGTASKINEDAGKVVAKSVVPEEGSVGFIDGPMLVKGAKNRENGLKFINWFAGDLGVREYVFDAYRAAPCSQTAVEALVAKGGETERLVRELKGPEPEIATRVVQGRLPDDPKAYAAAWDAVLA